MKRSQLSVLAITLAGLVAGQAVAADTSTVTREQVRAELAQAVRAGDVVVNNETGERLNARQSGRHASVGSAKSRAEVSAELAAATRAGWVVIDNQTGLMLKDLQPASRGQTTAAGGATREQVKAELAEAVRNGDVVVNNATGEKLNTLVPGFDKRDSRA